MAVAKCETATGEESTLRGEGSRQFGCVDGGSSANQNGSSRTLVAS